jgi:cytidine deaminase
MTRHLNILADAISVADDSETHYQVGAVLVKGNQTWYGSTKDRQILGGQFTGMSICAEKDAMFQVRHARNLKNTIVRTMGLGLPAQNVRCLQHPKGKDR